MVKDYKISIKNYQPDFNGKSEISVSTDCIVIFDNGNVSIIYNESDTSTGLENTQTQILVSAEMVSIVRKGDYSSTMTFEASRETLTTLETPYGCVDFIVCTNEVNVSFSDNGVIIKLDYYMKSCNESELTRCCVLIECISA